MIYTMKTIESVIFVFIVLILIAGLFYEIMIEHERKLIRLSENANKRQKERLVRKAYFAETKFKILN